MRPFSQSDEITNIFFCVAVHAITAEAMNLKENGNKCTGQRGGRKGRGNVVFKIQFQN